MARMARSGISISVARSMSAISPRSLRDTSIWLMFTFSFAKTLDSRDKPRTILMKDQDDRLIVADMDVKTVDVRDVDHAAAR